MLQSIQSSSIREYVKKDEMEKYKSEMDETLLIISTEINDIKESLEPCL
jgi:hypothetical protein